MCTGGIVVIQQVIQQLPLVSVTCLPEGLPLPVNTPTQIGVGNANGSFETVIFHLIVNVYMEIDVIQLLTLVSVTSFPNYQSPTNPDLVLFVGDSGNCHAQGACRIRQARMGGNANGSFQAVIFHLWSM